MRNPWPERRVAFRCRAVAGLYTVALFASMTVACSERLPDPVEPSSDGSGTGGVALPHAVVDSRDLLQDLDVDVPDQLPQYFTDDSALVHAVRESAGVVHIGFKPPHVPRFTTRVTGPAGARRAVVRAMPANVIDAGKAAVTEAGGEIVLAFRSIPGVVATIEPEAAPRLRENPLIDYVDPASSGEPGSQVTPANMIQIRAPVAWSLSNRGLNVYVVILDTGIAGGVSSHHPDLHTLLGGWCMYASPTFSTCADDPGYGVFYGHGTGVAGVLIAQDNGIGVIGAAPAAHPSWTMIRVCGPGVGCWSPSVAAGLDWTAQNGRKDIVNMSFHGNYNAGVATAVAAAYSAGDLLFAIAGNTVTTSTVTYPGKYSQVIAVSGVTAGDQGHSGSVSGPEVELSAPFTVLSLGNTSGTQTRSGTSYASPAAAGVGALVWGENPSWTNAQVRSRLHTSALDLGPFGRDNVYGYGRVDAGAAVGYPPPSVSIGGPSAILSSGNHTWTANPSGGIGGYTYNWYRKTDYWWPRGAATCHYETAWQLVGTGPSYNSFVSVGDLDFRIRVDIMSGNESATASRLIQVGDGSQPCPM